MNHDAEVVAIGAGESAGGESVPAVVLAVRDEVLPIFVTPSQAHSIGMVLRGEPFDRPLTHDLLTEVLTEFGGAVDRVRIDDLTEGTFYAKVDVERYDDGRAERFVFDARPSDALALAVRSECEIVVSDEVIDEAGRPPEAFGFDVEGEVDGGLGADEDDDPPFGGDPDDPFGR